MSAARKPLFISFTRGLAGYAGSAFGIAFLNLISLGLYKPYGVTRVRRALYNNINIGAHALEYTGNASSLSAVTFYPSLAFLFLLVVPGVLQFMVPFGVAIAIGVVQMIFVVMFYHYRNFLERQYELSNISWQAVPFTLTGEAASSMWRTLGFSLANLFTLGFSSLWRRIWVAKRDYDGLYYGRQQVSCHISAEPLLKYFIPGWLASVGGLVFLWFYLRSDIEAVSQLMSGATGAVTADADTGYYGSMGGIPGMDNMGGMDMMNGNMGASPNMPPVFGSIFNLLLSFQVWLSWRMLCMAPYEAAWWRELADSVSLQNYRLRFEGGMVLLFLINVISFNINFIMANLTRPFTTYVRLRYFCGNMLVQEIQDK